MPVRESQDDVSTAQQDHAEDDQCGADDDGGPRQVLLEGEGERDHHGAEHAEDGDEARGHGGGEGERSGHGAAPGPGVAVDEEGEPRRQESEAARVERGEGAGAEGENEGRGVHGRSAEGLPGQGDEVDVLAVGGVPADRSVRGDEHEGVLLGDPEPGVQIAGGVGEVGYRL